MIYLIVYVFKMICILFIFNKNFFNLNQISEPDSLLDTTKLEIYKNLPKCEYHTQGCLIAEDGRHLKLNNEMITIWARSMVKN